MKIGIITIHYGFNFGSALQAYALAKYINGKTEDLKAVVIDYIPERYSVKRRYFTTNKPYGLLKKFAYFILVAPQRIYNQHVFNKFLRGNVPMSRRIYDLDTAKKYAGHWDILIAGSDQVWNSDYNEGIDPMYYLAFASSKTKRVSYAASCGKEEYSVEEWKLISSYLTKFSCISLREESSVELFKNHGYKNVMQSLDPVFLLDKSEWADLMVHPRNIPKAYVLIYCLDSDEADLIRIAKQVAEKRGLKTAIVSYCHVWNRYDTDYVFRNQSPNNFLWLVMNADYVVTNSFHGVAFSINLEKQFLAVKRRKYNNRLDSILNIMRLTDRYISYDADFDNREDIDYVQTSEIKRVLVKKSEDFIQAVINDDMENYNDGENGL